MQVQMPDLPYRITIVLLIVLSSHLGLTAAGGWMLYQSAIEHMNETSENVIEQIGANGERIDELGERVAHNTVLIVQNGERIARNAELIARNAELIARNAELITHNGEQITQLRERMAAVEVRVGAVEDIVRYFHPPDDDLTTNP